MPAKNRAKEYLESGYYHLYNRGTEKRTIFVDHQDYNVFLGYLKEYLLPKNESELLEKLSDTSISSIERDNILKLLRLNNFHNEITMLAYCLMPNHFHFFIHQASAKSIDKFMNSLGTRYTMYFNKKYKRVGSLYQGVYKGVLIRSEEQFLHLSRYIHQQALPHQPSSYKNYVSDIKDEWVNSQEVLNYFSKTNPNLSYESFIQQKDDLLIQDIVLDEE